MSIKNFRSIRAARVNLEPLTVFVGPNGAGKSSILAALRFVTEAMGLPLDQAMRTMGGIGNLRRKAARGRPPLFGVSLDLVLKDGRQAFYGYELRAAKNEDFEVQREVCWVEADDINGGKVGFDRRTNWLTTYGAPSLAPKESNLQTRALALLLMSGEPLLGMLHQALASMRFHAIAVDAVRSVQVADAGVRLTRDGSNLASVLKNIARNAPASGQRLQAMLHILVPDVVGVQAVEFGARLGLRFSHGDGYLQPGAGATGPKTFPLDAEAESDGTLRMLGILVATLSADLDHPLLLGIEDPEATIHVGAFGLLLDALREAGRHTQVLLTTHSADLLDGKAIEPESIRIVTRTPEGTAVTPLDQKRADAIRRQLVMPGDLLRSGTEDVVSVPSQSDIDLFDLAPGK